MKLLNVDANAKTVKGQKKGYVTGIMYLAPANLSGYEVCPMRSKGCTEACLNTAGRGRFSKTKEARLRRTKMFFEDRANFMLLLEREIKSVIRRAEKKGMIPAIRLNGTSDIPWESIPFVSADGKTYSSMMARFPSLQFYDYTKRHIRKPTKNYHLTYSLAEDNDERAKLALKSKMNVAVVFDGKPPKRFWHRWVIDGDETDLRFLDKKVRIVALKAKGKARKDKSGFVRRLKVVS